MIYRCPTCGVADPMAWRRCSHPGCPDGRDVPGASIVDDVLQAASMTLGACEFCPGVHINLHDADGKVFATAVVPVDRGSEFIVGFDQQMSVIRARLARDMASTGH